MNQLLWLLGAATPRNFLIAAFAAALVVAARVYGPAAKHAYLDRRYPPATAAPDAAISADLEKKSALRLRARYRRIQGLLEEARDAGFAVDGQAAKARAALALENGGFRDEALRVLTELEMQIPKRRQQYIPMDASEEIEQDAWPDEQPAKVPRSAKKPRARRAR